MKRKHSLLDSLKIVGQQALLPFLIIFVASWIAHGFKEISGETGVLVSVLAMVASNLTIILAYALFLNRRGRDMADEIKANGPITLNWVGISVLVSFIPLLIGIFSNKVIQPIFFETANTTTELLNYDGSFSLVVSVFYPLVLAPITEEFIYRGISGNLLQVFDDYTPKGNRILFVLLSSFFFALMHLQTGLSPFGNFISFFSPFVSGIVFSSLYLKGKHLAYPMIAHILYNSLVLFMSQM